MNTKFQNKEEWKESYELVLATYELMGKGPKEEYENPFSLSNEIKNTVIGIPSKLSAGYELGGDFLTENLMEARGLLVKLEYLLTVAAEMNLVETVETEKLIKRARDVWELLIE